MATTGIFLSSSYALPTSENISEGASEVTSSLFFHDNPSPIQTTGTLALVNLENPSQERCVFVTPMCYDTKARASASQLSVVKVSQCAVPALPFFQKVTVAVIQHACTWISIKDIIAFGSSCRYTQSVLKDAAFWNAIAIRNGSRAPQSSSNAMIQRLPAFFSVRQDYQVKQTMQTAFIAILGKELIDVEKNSIKDIYKMIALQKDQWVSHLHVFAEHNLVECIDILLSSPKLNANHVEIAARSLAIAGNLSLLKKVLGKIPLSGDSLGDIFVMAASSTTAPCNILSEIFKRARRRIDESSYGEALIYAVSKGSHDKVVFILRAVQITSEEDSSLALMTAVNKGDPIMIRRIFKSSSLNISSKAYRDAVAQARKMDSREVLEALDVTVTLAPSSHSPIALAPTEVKEKT